MNPPASLDLCNGGEGEGRQREEIVQILLSSWHDLFMIFLPLTKQTAPLYLGLFFICSDATHLSCQPLNVSTLSTRGID